jgi:hypothetical protein
MNFIGIVTLATIEHGRAGSKSFRHKAGPLLCRGRSRLDRSNHEGMWAYPLALCRRGGSSLEFVCQL